MKRLGTMLIPLVLVAGCLETASNYDEVLPPVGEGPGPVIPGQGGPEAPSSDGSGAGDGTSGDGSGDTDGVASTDGAGDTEGSGDADGSSTDGSSTDGSSSDGSGDGPIDPNFESAIKGTALEASCSSYGKETATACAGFYCGVDKELIEAELPHFRGACEPTVDDVCSGKITFKVASCARSVKSNPFNALDSDETIRMKTRDCIYQDATITASETCLDCFLDAAQCASDHCLTQCLTGDSPDCDSCRLQNNCNQPVPACAGTPDPF